MGMKTRAAPQSKATGFRDRPLDYLGTCWALSPGKVTMGPEEARSVAFRHAVARIRGRGLFEAEERSVYGLEAMDAWIAHMKEVPFCSACAHAGPQGMAGCDETLTTSSSSFRESPPRMPREGSTVRSPGASGSSHSSGNGGNPARRTAG